VEAIESVGAGFAVGVQFHPERLLGVGPQFLCLFEVFIEACRLPKREMDSAVTSDSSSD
jgi:gamma-glutamyl-gamma-aminobutyrate hydrolase PuuD